LIFSLFSGCLSSTETKPIVYSVSLGRPATLKCEQEDGKWSLTQNDTTTEVEADEENYQLEEGTLKILNIKESHIGVYSCEVDGTVLKSYELSTSLKIKKFPKSISVNDGLPRELTCTFNSPIDQKVVFNWFRTEEGETDDLKREKLCSLKGSVCSDEDVFETLSEPPAEFRKRAEIEESMDDGIQMSTLTITKSQLADRKVYICQAKLEKAETIEDCGASKECDESQVLLRVKDPLAALYPFVGIVAEVIILCIIIFFCEKNKSQDKEDYDETAGNGNGSTVASSNSNIRQRK